MLNWWLTFVLAFLSMELILYSLTHNNYMFTFFFWLDLLGTVSLLMDIPWIMIGLGMSQNIFMILSGGRAGKAARSAGSAKMIKILKMIKMIKLFRIVHILKKTRSDIQVANEYEQTRGTINADKVMPFILYLYLFVCFF